MVQVLVVYIGVGSPDFHWGLWRSRQLIALVAKFSEVEDLDHFYTVIVIGSVSNKVWLSLASGISKLFLQLVSDWVT